MFSRALHVPSKHRILALADVSSAGAGVGIFSLHPGMPANLLCASRVRASFDERDRDHLASVVLDRFDIAIEEATKRYRLQAQHRSVDTVAAIIRAPWSRSKTVRAVSKFPKETTITASMISTIAQEILADESEFAHDDIFEKDVTRVAVNGYPTSHPEGKQGTEVAVSALFSVCDTSIRSGVEERILKAFGMHPILYSDTRALSTLITHRICPEDSLIVEMTGEATAMFGFHASAATQYAVIPEGTHSIVRRIAGAGVPEDTLSRIRMLGSDHCDIAACADMQAKMTEVEPDLARIFGEALGVLASVRRLPNTLVLIAHPDLVSWLSRFFARVDFAQFTITTQPFTVSPLSLSGLGRLAVPAEGTDADLTLLIGGALVNSELNHQ